MYHLQLKIGFITQINHIYKRIQGDNKEGVIGHKARRDCYGNVVSLTYL